MKNVLFAFVLTLIAFGNSYSQWSTHTMTHDGIQRDYRLYLPDNYNSNNPASLIFTLHGLGDTMDNFSLVGFDKVADTTNFIVVVPQAIADIIAGTAWNSQAGIYGYYPNTHIDDIGFLNTLTDNLINQYAIDTDRVFMTGYSMGGFMTQRMACESNTKFAGFASVAGTIGSGMTGCSPNRPVPVAHFHGTADSTVDYNNNSFGMNVPDLINTWVAINNTSSIPIHTVLPDTSNDGFTIDHYLYTEGNADVELFKVNGADHQWLYKPLNDIAYTEEIIRFFLKNTTPLSTNSIEIENKITVFPNPVSDYLTIRIGNQRNVQQADVIFYDVLGRTVYQTNFSGTDFSFSPKNHGILPGVYLVKIELENTAFTKRIVVE